VRIVFLGTPRVAVASLQALVHAGHDVPLVVTRPDRPHGRSGRPQPPPVKRAAVEGGLAVHQPTKVKNRAFLDELGRHRPDVLVVVAYGRILTRAVLELAPAGAINVHFSLLPKFRGAAPVQWTLAHGERTAGVTTMQVEEALDAGDILLQREVPIEPGEHAPALQERLAGTGAELLVRTLGRLEAGSLEPRPQDHARATLAPMLTAADGNVDLEVLGAREIEGRVRGFDPWPGVWVDRAGRRLRLVEATDAGRVDPEAAPGQVLGLEGEGLMLACADRTLLRVTAVQPEGRRVMTARDAVNGRQVAPGDRLARLDAGP
jgi:methionyl-tRNA formyltransferase